MIMVRKSSGEVHPPGLAKMKELIKKRVQKIAPHLSLETELFDTEETLERLCLMSGGHVRDLMKMMREANQTQIICQLLPKQRKEQSRKSGMSTAKLPDKMNGQF
jgi:hypothetical protein